VVPTADEPGIGPIDEPDSHRTTTRNAAVMSTGTFLSRGTGVIRVMVTLAALGATTPLSNSYFLANTTPNIIYELVLGGILTSVFVPLLVDWRRAHGAEAEWEAGSRFLTLALVTLSVVTLIAMVAAPQIMRIYLSGVENPADYQAELEFGTFFLRWFLPQIVFYGIGAVAAGLLTANRRFSAPMFAPVLNNIVVILTMLLFISIRHGASLATASVTSGQQLLLAAGTTFGVITMTVALWPSLRRLGFRWHLRFDWRHETVRRLLHLARWVAVYVIANQIAYFIIIVFSGRIGTGSYVVYSQAFIFFSLPHAIVAVSIFTALLPGMSGRWADGNIAGVRELFSRGLRDTEIVMLPAAAGFIVLAGPIVALLASYGAMQSDSTELLGRTLAAFAVGLPFFSAFQFLTRTFYAMQDAKTPAVANIAVGVVNLAMDLWFAFGLGLGVVGLALGYAASYAAGSAILYVLVRKRLGDADGRRIADTVGRALAASILTAVAAWAAAEGVATLVDVSRPLMRLVQVGAGVGAGVLAFALGALIFKIQEADEVWQALSARFRR
jgi:putative peptidoglycan lipid II flippase